MKEIIAEKLDQMDMLFPPARVEASKARIQSVWEGKVPADRYPFVFLPATFEYYNDVHSAEERLMKTLDEIIFRGQFEDDFIPSIFPGCKQGTIPGMFGAKEVVCGDDYSNERIVFSEEDVYKLPEPALLEGSSAKEWIGMQEYFLRETDGRLGIHVTDMQGPADICGKLWGYDNLLVCAYTDPGAFHHIMTKATDAFILLWNAQKEALQDNFIGTHLFGWSWVPRDLGATASVDSMVMVSGDFFDEYFAPYLNRISDAFGGITIHSCGKFPHLMENICKINNIRGINASQMTVQEMREAGLGNRLVTISNALVEEAPEMFRLSRDHGMRNDLVVLGLWPGDPFNPDPVDTWTQADWTRIRKNNETLLEAARI